ncbi:nitroreductase family protein [Anaerobacillus alkaliphilus]|nr:nitroreductase family protein [Anaerobacillus alkaliphilus]
MVLRFEKWFKAIQIRRSRRTYVTKQIESDSKEVLTDMIVELNQRYTGVKVVFVEKAPDAVFVGAVGPYGKITGAPAYLALVIDTDENFNYEKAGFIGQACVLEATLHGLSSCWVGGYFNKVIAAEEVGINENERVVAVIPIGYARKNLSLTEKMMNQVGDYHKRKSVEDISEGLAQEQWPDWVGSVVKSASLSPSAYNRQSIHFVVGEDGETITLRITNPSEETNVPKGIDRGIAMLHTEVATNHLNIPGAWHYDKEANVVAFQKS